MMSVAMFFPHAYRTSYDILLEFQLFIVIHSQLEKISQMAVSGLLNLSSRQILRRKWPQQYTSCDRGRVKGPDPSKTRPVTGEGLNWPLIVNNLFYLVAQSTARSHERNEIPFA